MKSKQRLKMLVLVAILMAATPVSSFATMITGQIDVIGTVNLGSSAFNTLGTADLNDTGIVLIGTDDFFSLLFGPVDLFDIDFASPGKIWAAGDFSFTATSFSNFQDGSTKAFDALGVITGTGFDATAGQLSLTAQGNATTVSFSSTTVPSPVPLPAAAWLFGSALIGAGLLGRRKKKAA